MPSSVPAATATITPHEGNSHARRTIAISTEASTCAAAPSTVLRGLTTGASLWRAETRAPEEDRIQVAAGRGVVQQNAVAEEPADVHHGQQRGEGRLARGRPAPDR